MKQKLLKYRKVFIPLADHVGTSAAILLDYVFDAQEYNQDQKNEAMFIDEKWFASGVIDHIAERCSLSRNTVKRAIKKLGDEGLLEVIERPGERSLYRATRNPAHFEPTDPGQNEPTLGSKRADPYNEPLNEPLKNENPPLPSLTKKDDFSTPSNEKTGPSLFIPLAEFITDKSIYPRLFPGNTDPGYRQAIIEILVETLRYAKQTVGDDAERDVKKAVALWCDGVVLRNEQSGRTVSPPYFIKSWAEPQIVDDHPLGQYYKSTRPNPDAEPDSDRASVETGVSLRFEEIPTGKKKQRVENHRGESRLPEHQKVDDLPPVDPEATARGLAEIKAALPPRKDKAKK